MSSKKATKTSSKTTFLLTGVTGNTGGKALEVLDAQSKRRSKRIIALVRDESKGDALAKTVEEVRVGDGDKKRTLKSAFQGVDVALVIPPNGGKNYKYRRDVTENYLTAAKEAGVRRVVLLSVWKGESSSIFYKQMNNAEKLAKGFPEWVIVRAPLFMENFVGQAQNIQDGKYFAMGGRKGASPLVAISDVGEALAAALTSKAKAAEYVIVNDKQTNAGIAATFSGALGHKVEYVEIDEAAQRAALAAAQWPKWQIDGVVELFQTIHRMEVTGDFKKLTKKDPLVLADWVEASGAALGGRAEESGSGSGEESEASSSAGASSSGSS